MSEQLTNKELRLCAGAMIAHANLEPVEVFDTDWPQGGWIDDPRPIWACFRYKYRPKYKPVSRPWSKPEDVPGPVCWIRSNNGPIAWLICAVTSGGCRILADDSETSLQTWIALSSHGEYSTDRKIWSKCEVIE